MDIIRMIKGLQYQGEVKAWNMDDDPNKIELKTL